MLRTLVLHSIYRLVNIIFFLFVGCLSIIIEPTMATHVVCLPVATLPACVCVYEQV